MNPSNDPKLKSWVDISKNSDFPIQNLPFGLFQKDNYKAGAIAIGEKVLDLSVLFKEGFFENILAENVFAKDCLNDFLALGKNTWSKVRARLSELLKEGNSELKENKDVCAKAFFEQSEVTMLLPIKVQNFADFYSSIEHATNVGKMFRPTQAPLLPNWKHIPVGYNGRASSVVVSETDIVRPCGQTKADDQEAPSFGPCRLLDIELEMGFITGAGNPLGTPISIENAADHIFGMVLLNDWSARDIQKWEYVPLGPFLGKSFATSISPWIVTLEALEPFRIAGPNQDPPVLPYLQSKGNWGFDIHLEAHLKTEKMEQAVCISKTNFCHMYWSCVQQLAHLASNGTNIEAGDLYGSGTISGTTQDSLGSMLELAWKGTRPLKFDNGEERKFLLNHDTVVLKGWGQGEGYRVGFGQCVGKILPARE